MKVSKNCSSGARAIIVGVVLAALFGFYNSAAQAKTVRVKSGKSKLIAVIGHIDGENCASHLLKSKITGKAENGEVTLKWSKYTVPDGHCKGARIDVIVVTYRSKRGYVGTDKVRVAYRAPRRRFAQSETAVVRTKKYTVRVE